MVTGFISQDSEMVAEKLFQGAVSRFVSRPIPHSGAAGSLAERTVHRPYRYLSPPADHRLPAERAFARSAQVD